MTAQVFNLQPVKKYDNNNKPLLSMFMVRRTGKFKVITNLSQLSPQELVYALVRDAVCDEREKAMQKQFAE